MRTFWWMLGGAILGGGLTFLVGITLPMITPVSQREGGYAMGVIFFMTPAGTILGALAGLVVRLVRGR